MSKKKIIIISIGVFVIFILGVFVCFLDYIPIGEHRGLKISNEKCDPNAECCTDNDCTKGFDNDGVDWVTGGGMPIYLPCFRGRCQNPEGSKEMIEYCNNPERSTWQFLNNCYNWAAIDALYESKEDDDVIVWDDAFKICEQYVLGAEKQERCKLDVCSSMGSDPDNKIRHECDKEAISNSSCFDKKENGTETDIDCGGEFCDPCEIRKKCSEDGDCLSNICYYGGGYSRCINKIDKCPNGRLVDVIPDVFVCSCGGNNQSTSSLGMDDSNGNFLYCCDDKIVYNPPLNNDFGSVCPEQCHDGRVVDIPDGEQCTCDSQVIQGGIVGERIFYKGSYCCNNKFESQPCNELP